MNNASPSEVSFHAQSELPEHELIDTGIGSYARMKAAMNSHIAQERHTMFQSSADNIRNQLNTMVQGLKTSMLDKADEVFIMVRRDYNSVLGEGELPQTGELLPKTQRLMRKEIIRIIDGVCTFSDKLFLFGSDIPSSCLTARLFALRNADLEICIGREGVHESCWY